jgi:nicotinamide mononucleotide adenylyltransferase
LTTAIYLAHLNPVTNAHLEIIDELKSQSDNVQVMPVIFMKGDSEVNSRSFPFSFEIRKKMLESVFGDSITVSRNYTFYAPFSKYMPPVLSPNSWKLRKQILQGIEDDYFTYTGDKAEGYMLKIYRLKPKVGIRKEVSAASVKNKLYDAVNGSESNWKDDVPEQVVKIIEENWSTVEKFANMEDKTTRVVGMKFPKEGWSK